MRRVNSARSCPCLAFTRTKTAVCVPWVRNFWRGIGGIDHGLRLKSAGDFGDAHNDTRRSFSSRLSPILSGTGLPPVSAKFAQLFYGTVNINDNGVAAAQIFDFSFQHDRRAAD